MKNYLQEKLKKNQSVLGTWSIIPDQTSAEIIASSGIDFLIIDKEHGHTTYETSRGIIQACEAQKVSPLIRVPKVDESEILKALELGVHGIHIPNICTIDDIYRVINYAFYPPIGKRGYSPFTRFSSFTPLKSSEFIKDRNHQIMIAIHLEGHKIFDSIDKILALSGIDILFIGLFDLSQSLNIPGQIFHEKTLNYLKNIIKKSKQTDKSIGSIATSPKEMNLLIDLGVNYLTYSADCDILYRSYAHISDLFRNQINNNSTKSLTTFS